ncbi:hypothetical protein ACRRTK_003318 [Alexandromys fortis]
MESCLAQAFTEELNCFICMSYLTDPVTISCGHSFCRACLHLSWEDSQFPVQCPMCREPSQQKNFRTNIVLKKLVSIARQASLMKFLSSEEHQCVTHKEIKGIFCMENRIYLCQLCSDSHMHRGHRHCRIEAAAEGEMDYLLTREDMIRMEYRKWHAVLCKEEEEHIEHMKNEGNRVLEKLRECEAMMIQKSKQLREMFQELMAMSHEPYVVLLQGLDDIFRRSESMQLNIPQSLEPELSAFPMIGLTERFKSFKDLHLREYYWELDLEDSWDWTVSVCMDSWLQNTSQVVEMRLTAWILSSRHLQASFTAGSRHSCQAPQGCVLNTAPPDFPSSSNRAQDTHNSGPSTLTPPRLSRLSLRYSQGSDADPIPSDFTQGGVLALG